MDEKKQTEEVILDDEKVLDFDQAKDLTIAEAVRKHEEIVAGVTDEDSVLDRYIKQHRQEIESQKFETTVLPLTELETPVNDDWAGVAGDEAETKEHEVLSDVVLADLATADEAPLPAYVMDSLEDEPEDFEQEEETARKKNKQIVFLSLASLAFVGLVAVAFIWMNAVNQANKETTTTSSSQTSTTSSSSTDATVTAFDQLYKSFFTDSELTKLKNSEFGKLAELKALLDKIDQSTDAYTVAKDQYDKFEKAIAAIQALNSQFDKPVVVDGEIDTTATANPGANLVATTTGLSSVDSQIASAVNFGLSQQASAANVAAPVDTQETSVTGAGGDTSTAADTTTAPATTAVTDSGTSFGIAIPAGVVLQRELSRVPYDQAAINDTSNPAWTFGQGILENIIAISQQRGYIVGNQYILDKVAIINGNGYYNLFKPDGTYLFSINCKTGYFVGNAPGNADALDY